LLLELQASEPQHFLYDPVSIASRQLTNAPAAVATTTSKGAVEVDRGAPSSKLDA